MVKLEMGKHYRLVLFVVAAIAATSLAQAKTLLDYDIMSERERTVFVNDRAQIIYGWLKRNEPHTAKCMAKRFKDVIPGKRYSQAALELLEYFEKVPKHKRSKRIIGATMIEWIRTELCES